MGTLVALARGGTDKQKEQAARALMSLASNMAYNNADNKVRLKVAVAKAGGIAPLVALARGGTTDAQKGEATYALGCLAENADIKVAMANAGWERPYWWNGEPLY